MFIRVGALLVAACIVSCALAAQTLWVGSLSTDWATAGNWSPAAVPTATDNVNIGVAPFAPTIPASTTVNSLTVLPGAILTGTTGTLSLNGDFIVHGTYVPGTALINMVGTAAAQIGGTGALSINRLQITKNARTTLVTMNVNLSLTSAAASSTVGANPLDIQTGTLVTNGFNLNVTGRTYGNTNGDLRVTAPSVVNLNSIYGWNLGYTTIQGGTVNISGLHEVVNSGHRCDVSGGVVNYTNVGTCLQLYTNNTGWGYYITGGEVNIAGSINTNSTVFFLNTGGIVRFTGAGNTTTRLTTNSWNFGDLRIEKTGGAGMTFTAGSAMASDVLISSLTVNAGAAITMGGTWTANTLGIAITNINNSGTINFGSVLTKLSGNVTTLGAGTSTGAAGGKVDLVGAGQQTFTGSSTFATLACAVGGKQLLFEAGSTLTITSLLQLVGTAANVITLRSTSTGIPWNLNNIGGAFIRYVDVRDSNAANPVVNAPGGVDSGNNTNWFFTGGIAVQATVGTPLSVNANETGNGNGVVGGRFNIDNISTGSMTVTSISITAGGTGADNTAYTEVALYQDNPTAGTQNTFDPADTLFGAAVPAFPANDGTIVFTQNLVLPLSASRAFFVVVKLDGPVKAAAGQTFTYTASAVTVVSGTIAGTPSEAMAGLLITAPLLNWTYPTNPANTGKQVPPTYTGPGGNGFELTQMIANVPGSAPINIVSVTLTNIGSATTSPLASTMYTRFELHKDTNGSGVWDAGDTLIGVNTPVLPAVFTFQAAEQAHLGGSATKYFVIGGLNAPNLPANGITFNFYISSMVVNSAYPGATFGGTGSVRNGATVNTSTTLGLLFTRAADSPLASVTQTETGPGGNGFVAGRFVVDNLSATTAGSLSSFTVTLNASTATFIPRAYTDLKFFQDSNSNGTWDPADQQIGNTVLGSTLSAVAVSTAVLPAFSAVAPISFPAASSTSFFLVVKFNGTPLPVQNVTYRAFISTVGIGVNTTSSGVSTGNTVGAFIVPNVLAVAANAGTAQGVYSNETGPANQGIEAGSFTITANNSAGSELNSISLEAVGTGDDAAAYSEVAIYRDGVAGNVGSYDNANDTLIGTFATFPADDGTLLFPYPVADKSFAANEARTYFVVVKLNATASPGQTLQYRISDIGVNIGKGGVPSAVMLGLTINAPSFDFTDNSAPAIAPGYAGQGGFVIQQFTVEYLNGPANTLTSITFTGISTGGNLQQHITSAELYRDDNANGTFDAGVDVLVNGQPGFNIANQVTFTLAGAESQFTASATVFQYFVVVAFDLNTPNLSTFRTQLTTADGGSVGTNYSGTPAPAAGAAPGLEVFANNLLVTLNGPAAALTVDNTSQGIGGIGEVLWDGTIATLAGAWTVSDLTFTATGTANQNTAYSFVALYEDLNTNGVFDGPAGGDALADPAPAGGFGPGATYTAVLANSAFAAQTSRRFFLVVRLSGTATTGQTLNAELTSANGAGPVGGQITGDLGASSTALIIDLPSITLAGAPTPPAATTLKAGTAQTVPVGRFRFTAANNAVDVSGVTLTTGGNGDWVNDFSATNGVQVWLDNGDGNFNSVNDTKLFEGAGGLSVVATFSSNVSVANNSTRDIWVVVSTTATAGVGASVPFNYGIGIPSAGDVSTVGGVTVLLGAPAAQSATFKIVDFFVTDFTPTTDLLVGGRDIVITGSGFEGPVVVRIGGTICPGVAVITPTEISGLTVPPGFGANLAIEIDSGTLPTQTLTQTFTYATPTKPKSSDGGCVASAATSVAGLLVPALLAVATLRRRRK